MSKKDWLHKDDYSWVSKPWLTLWELTATASRKSDGQRWLIRQHVLELYWCSGENDQESERDNQQLF